MASSPEPPARDRTFALVRHFLLAILAFGIAGTLVELVLLEHYEDLAQWIPLVLLVIGLVAIVWRVARPGRTSLRALQATMLLFVVAGMVGVVLHLRGNLAFELENSPELRGMELFWKVIMGATPTLAPGTLVQFGLIGLVYAFRHPDLAQPSRNDEALG